LSETIESNLEKIGLAVSDASIRCGRYIFVSEYKFPISSIALERTDCIISTGVSVSKNERT